jgi:hypothetical protein
MIMSNRNSRLAITAAALLCLAAPVLAHTDLLQSAPAAYSHQR